MDVRRNVPIRNWKGSIQSHPAVVARPECVEDLVAIMRDASSYPAPVRGVGSNHSTTACAVAEGGTVVDMTRMKGILEITGDTVTAQAGALYIDVAKQLEGRGLQLFVNIELGNLTIGSAACGGTKDASQPGEFGQVNSYCVGIKMVLPNGELLEVGEDDPALLKVARSSYGLLGVIYEATFRVKQLRPIMVDHHSYRLEEFIAALPMLKKREESMMLYLFPFLDRVVVEARRDSDEATVRNRFLWRFRNWTWKNFAPGFGYLVSRYIGNRWLRYFLVDWLNYALQLTMGALLRSRSTSPADQMIRYPDEGDWRAYTFSIWAFPEHEYPDHIRAYYAFCRDYYARTGFRCDMLNVGYRLSQDESSLFSYTANGPAITLDPVATGQEGWNDFIAAYNVFCSERGGIPLFNQTKALLSDQARRAFEKELPVFEELRRQYDPEDRLLNDYFKGILEGAVAHADAGA